MHRTILQLCADTGSDTWPYRNDPDYEVITIGQDIGVENYSPDRPIHGIIANPVCFTAGAPIVTKRGIIGVEDVTVGDEVLTHRNRWRKVTRAFSRKAGTVNLGNITVTPDHPFLAREQWRKWDRDLGRSAWGLGDAEWTAAAELHGKFTAIPQTAEATAEVAPPVSWWLVGRWVADGFGRTPRKAAGGEVHIAVGKGKGEEFERHAADWKPTPKRTATVYVKYGSDLLAWLKEHFGYGAAGKTIPGWLLAQPESARREFLSGYLSGDGHSPKPGKWSATTVSLNLAVGIRLIAESLGWTSLLSKNKRRDTGVIEGRKVSQRQSWTVALSINDGRYSRTIDGMRWVKQRKAVEPGNVETVHCLSVEEDESYIAWGFAVHNCTEFSPVRRGKPGENYPHVSDPEKGMFLVRECQRIIAEAQPVWWAIENPAMGTLRNYLGKPDFTYQPWWYGSPWTKSTALWGNFTPPPRRYHSWDDVPGKLDLWTRPGRTKPSIVYLHKSAFNLIPEFRDSGMPAPESDAELRSLCSQNFARAFKLANP